MLDERGMARWLLQGRLTYQVSASAWPQRGGDPFSDWINATQKYVVSDTLAATDLTWGPATIVRGRDLSEHVSTLRAQDGGDIYVYGTLGGNDSDRRAGLPIPTRALICRRRID